jgi:hypothetical protein
MKQDAKIIVPSNSEVPPKKELVVRDDDAQLTSNVLVISR